MGKEYLAYLNTTKLAKYGFEKIRYSENCTEGEQRWKTYRIDGTTSWANIEILGKFYHAIPCCYGENNRALHPLYKIPICQVQYLDRVRQARCVSRPRQVK